MANRHLEKQNARVTIDSDEETEFSLVVYDSNGNLLCSVMTSKNKPTSINVTGAWDVMS